MPKKRARKTVSRRSPKTWGGFTAFQLIVILSVFIIFAIFYLMQ